jgi:hypothetical protein
MAPWRVGAAGCFSSRIISPAKLTGRMARWTAIRGLWSRWQNAWLGLPDETPRTAKLAWIRGLQVPGGLDLDAIVQHDSHPMLQGLGHICSVLIEGTQRRSDTESRFEPQNACLLRLTELRW